ncbi:MAG: hypothetical protein ACP5QT_00480 [Brevinematia bacterium]
MKEKIKQIVMDTIKELGYFCVEVNIMITKNNRKLKVVIYKKGSNISMNDCSDVSLVLRKRLDMEINGFSENYDLIVESPGVNRRLKNLDEISMFDDREMEFNLKNKIENLSKIVGWVKKISGNKLEIMDKNNIIYNVEWDNVSSAKLYFDIKKYI